MSERHAPTRVPRRLIVLLVLGVVVVVGAVQFRSSQWAREYQLKRTSLEALREQAKADPKDPLFYFHLGTKAYNAKSLGEAGYCFQEAIKLSPKMARAHQGLAIVQRDAGNYPEAYASARRAQELDPKELSTQFLIATLVMHASESRAIPEFQKVVEKSPSWAEAWYHLGVCQEEFNQKSEALTSLRKAVSLEPKSSLYHRALGKVLLETNFFADARVHLEKARSLDNGDAQTAYLLGETVMSMAKTDEELRAADALFAESRTLVGNPTPENAMVLAQLSGSRGAVYTRLREPRKALEHVQEARRLAPRDPKYLYSEAQAQRLLGQEERARQLMAMYDRIARAENAAEQMTQRIKQDPEDPILRLKLARIYASAEDWARSVNQYEVCLRLDPKQQDARRELAAASLKFAAARKAADPAKASDPPRASAAPSP